MIPTTTGSATAIAEIFPELRGKLNGHAVRVPLANASLTDCVFEVEREITTAQEDGVSLDVGFYYMSNALGRLVGTLLSGWVFQAYGLETCLWVSSMFVLTAALISIGLPRHHEMKQQSH